MTEVDALLAALPPAYLDTNALTGFRGRYLLRWQYNMSDDEWMLAFKQALFAAVVEQAGR